MKRKIVLIAVGTLIIDLIIKLYIDNTFAINEPLSIISNFFALNKIYNDGASWNILAGHQFMIIIITILVLVALLIYQSKFKKSNRIALTFGLLYGGILGNLIDRSLYGYVIDYLDFNIFGYDFPVFNLADVAIVIGVFLLIIAIIKKEDESGT